MSMVKTRGAPKLRQANPLARSEQNMTLAEKRIITTCMSKIEWGQKDFATIELAIAELADLWNIELKHAYEQVETAVDRLVSRTIRIGGNTSKEPWKKFQWVKRATYYPGSHHASGSPHIAIDFHEDLQPFLLSLKKHYNTLPLLELLSLRSFNTVRLYEILWHDSQKGSKSFLTYELSDLKYRLGLEGKYKRFKDFRYVLDKAKDELDKYTSLKFSYEGIKRGRAVRQLRFHVWHVTNMEETTLVDIETKAKERNPLELKLIEAGYQDDPGELIAEYGEERVLRNLKRALMAQNNSPRTGKPIRNLGGLIRHMVKKDASDDVPLKKNSIDLEQLGYELLTTFEEALKEETINLWNVLSEPDKEAIEDQMRLRLPKLLVDTFDAQGWSGKRFIGARARVILKCFPEKLPEKYRSLEAYVKTSERVEDLKQTQRDDLNLVLTRLASD